MMPMNTHLSRPLERFVAVVTWFVDDVDQWWGNAILTRCIHTMTGRTFGFIAKLSNLSIL